MPEHSEIILKAPNAIAVGAATYSALLSECGSGFAGDFVPESPSHGR